MRVLIIEDSEQVMATIVDYLELEGIDFDCAYNGEQALALIRQQMFDVIVADIMMARMDGITAVRRIREQLKLQTPVIFLTARDTLEDKTAAFEAGGDDYLVKPFAMQELMLRLRAMTRRGKAADDTVLQLAALRHDLSTQEVTWEGRPLKLGRLQKQILALLLQHAPALVARQDIIQALWGEQPPTSDALRSHVYALRSALEHSRATVVLETVHGQGFRLVRNL